jgi:flagellar hook-length control protein FliK
MQANLNQNTDSDNRLSQARQQAQPLYADMLSQLFNANTENSFASTAPSANLFQRAFDEALQQRTEPREAGPADEQTHAVHCMDDRYATEREALSSMVARQHEGPRWDRQDYATARENDRSQNAPGTPEQNAPPQRDTGAAGTGQAAVSESAGKGSVSQAQTATHETSTEGKAAIVETSVKGAGTQLAANTVPADTSAESGTATIKQATKSEASASYAGGPSPGINVSSLTQASALTKQTLANAGQNTTAAGPGEPAPSGHGTEKNPSAPFLGSQVNPSAYVQGSLNTQMALKLAASIQTPAGTKASLSDVTSPTPGIGATAASAGLGIAGSPLSVNANPATPAMPSPSLGSSLMNQITQSMQTAARDNQRELIVQLHPAELGRIAIRFRQDGDQLIGMIQVGERQVRADIEQAIPQILQNLEQNGTQVRRIDVELLNDADTPASESGSQQHETTNSEAQERESSSQASEHRLDEDDPDSVATGTAADPVAAASETGSGRVNMLM